LKKEDLLRNISPNGKNSTMCSNMVIFWGKKSIFDHLKIEDLLRNISPNGKNSTKKKKKKPPPRQ